MKTIALLALTVLLLGIVALRIREDSRTNRIRSALRVPGEPQDVFSPEMVEGLPPVAQRYLLHAIRNAPCEMGGDRNERGDQARR